MPASKEASKKTWSLAVGVGEGKDGITTANLLNSRPA